MNPFETICRKIGNLLIEMDKLEKVCWPNKEKNPDEFKKWCDVEENLHNDLGNEMDLLKRFVENNDSSILITKLEHEPDPMLTGEDSRTLLHSEY
jgi:hypothetical protein